MVHPAQALLDHVCTFWVWAQVLRLAVTVAFAHGVATCGKGHCFFVIHGHAGKGQAHVLRSAQGVGLAVHAFGVHVDQAHLHSSQRVFQRLALVIFVTGRTQPFFFRAPVDVLLGVPNVFAAKGKAVGFEAHGLVGHIACQDDQVGPADAVAVFLFDGPQQAACFVEVDVIWPRVEWCKALVARAATPTAIGHAV